MAVEERNLPLEPVRERNVIRVKAGDIGRGGKLATFIERRDKTLMGPRRNSDPRIGSRGFLRDRGGLVGRAIVNDQAFKISKSLGENAVDRLTQEARGIIRGHHDGHPRC